MNKLLLSVTLAAASLFASAASAQVIYSASFATNPDQWGAFGWQDANGTISFASGTHMSFSTAGAAPYIGSYGPSGVPDWEPSFVPLDLTPLFAPGNTILVSYEARASAPNGVQGLHLELQTPFPEGYTTFSGALTSDWQTFTFTSFGAITGGADVDNVRVIAFATGGVNLGTVDIRNLNIEAVAAPIPEPSSVAALGGLAALAMVALRRRQRA